MKTTGCQLTHFTHFLSTPASSILLMCLLFICMVGAIACGAGTSIVSLQPPSDSYLISTVAGNGYGAMHNSGGYAGDNGLAVNAELATPYGVAVDSQGNIYIGDTFNNVVRKVSMTGTITTFAGTGKSGYSGDNGAAISSELAAPEDLAIYAGSLYIADNANHCIRKVDSNGIITTIAGNGRPGYSGDNGRAIDAELEYPTAVAVDASENIYIADYANNVVRKVSSAGIITTVAGNGFGAGMGYGGYTGDKGPAIDATLNAPQSIAVDQNGALYIADNGNNVIRKVDSRGIITTFAGNGVAGFSGDNGLATISELFMPSGVAIDSAGNLYIADSFNHRIRKVDSNGIITTIAGNGTPGYSGDEGLSTNAELCYPNAVAVVTSGTSGNIFIADLCDNVIRKLTPSAK